MKSIFQTKLRALLTAALLVIISAAAANAQEPSRLQLSSLDHLAAKASNSVDVNIDERLIRLALKAFSDKDAEERDIKKVIAGVKGIYVKVFEFESEGQFSSADLDTIRTQLRAPGWTRLLNVTSKKDGNFEVYLLMQGENVNGLAVLAIDVKEVAVVNIVGPVDIDKLAKLEGQLGIPELGIETTKKKNDDEQ